ncbi:hypothetical protein FOMA001_g1677 [Fusarium oxysporum f. sp. matthiolae]|nr:hypothetical protein FOMA001_g1677 [Fusarium oxysporum f. sp. matthiolae]
MARSISSLRSQKDGSSRSSSTSSDSKVSSTCDRESDTSSVNSDSSELQDTSSTYSGNSTDSTTVQVDFDHRGETSPLQPPFSPRMVSEHQSRPKYAGFSNYTHDPRAIYIDSLGRSPPRMSKGDDLVQTPSAPSGVVQNAIPKDSLGPSPAAKATKPPRLILPVVLMPLDQTRPRVAPVHRARL